MSSRVYRTEQDSTSSTEYRNDTYSNRIRNVTLHGTICMYVSMVSIFSGVRMNQPGMAADPACGQLNRKNEYFSCPRSRLKIWSRETGSAVPSRASLPIPHTQAECGAYSRDSSRFPRRRPFILFI